MGITLGHKYRWHATTGWYWVVLYVLERIIGSVSQEQVSVLTRGKSVRISGECPC